MTTREPLYLPAKSISTVPGVMLALHTISNEDVSGTSFLSFLSLEQTTTPTCTHQAGTIPKLCWVLCELNYCLWLHIICWVELWGLLAICSLLGDGYTQELGSKLSTFIAFPGSTTPNSAPNGSSYSYLLLV